tara:strand:+ start:632 stop:796 length:165 start_codon:yes stop_codon:yes gene_type:complete
MLIMLKKMWDGFWNRRSHRSALKYAGGAFKRNERCARRLTTEEIRQREQRRRSS